MTYVPTPVVVHTPSPRTRELAGRLAATIADFERDNPSTTSGEIREAARIALQVSSRGSTDPARIIVAAGALSALVGMGVFAAVGGFIDFSALGGFPVVAVIVAVAVVIPLIAILSRRP